jgi:hypothetical protein
MTVVATNVRLTWLRKVALDPTPIDLAWYMDTGAMNHLANSHGHLSVQEPYHGNNMVHTADGSGMRI